MFENLGKKIVGFGNGVKRGTQTFSETVSLNAKIDECKKELANCYSQLGQNYYERNKNNAPAEYQGIFDRITMLNQTIVQCQEQIKIIKGVRQCPNCGADVASNVMFCGNCGYSMPPSAGAQAPANGPVCANCGAPLEADAMFCTTCGAKVTAPVQQPVYEQPASQPQQYGQPAYEQPVYEQPAQQSELYGQPIQQPENSEQPASQPGAFEQSAFQAGEEQPADEAAGRICPKCGTQLAFDAAFCNNCGASLLAEEAAPQENYNYNQPAYGVTEEVQAEQPAVEEVPEFQGSEQPGIGQPAEDVKSCPNCGTKLESDALFCAECGTKVG